jgi:trimeric autotransporter adhesin
MNKVYKSVWNEPIGAWVAVSETAAARGKKSSGRARAPLGFSAIALAGASLGLPSTATLAAENRAAIFNDFTDGTCTAIYDGDTMHGTSIYTGAVCNPGLGNAGSATSIGLNGGGSGTNGTNLISNQSGAFINGGLEVFGSNVTNGSSAAYIHGGLSLFSNGTTSGTANKLIGLAAGTQSTDAVSVGQITPLVSALGGTAALNVDGSIKSPTYTLKSGTYNNVADALVALSASSGSASDKYLAANDSDKSSNGASVIGIGSLAIGGNALADSTGGTDSSIAIGSDSLAKAASATVIGPGATATAGNSVALGSWSVADRVGTVSVGSASNRRQIVNVAAGTQATDAVNVGQLTPVVTALGGAAAVNADGSVTAPTYSLKGSTYNNVGDALSALADSSGKYFHANSTLADSTATGSESIAVGGAAAANNLGDIAIGSNSSATDNTDPNGSAIAIGSHASAAMAQAVALGTAATASANGDVAIGTLAQATGTGVAGSATAVGFASGANGELATAMGYRANATGANSVALGARSVADADNTVSVGSSTAQRRIVNVAAGTQANDVVNVSQLQNVTSLLGGGAKVNTDGTIQAPAYSIAGKSSATVGDAIANIDTELSNKVAYDTTNKAHITLGGVGTSKLVTISNVNAGDLSSSSTDAVNGSQLNSTNQNVSGLQSFATNINNGGGIKYFHSNSALADSSATGTNAVAVGGAAVASANNSVALGANSVADRANSVSVGSAGNERQIINVADGSASKDAVNFGQLTAASKSVATLDIFSVKYDTNTDGTPNTGLVTLGAAGTGTAKPVKLTNLQVADLSTSSSDAVNGSQLFSTNTRVGSLETFANNINNGGGIKYFHSNSTRADSVATGADAVAIGGSALASANNSIALGANSVSDRKNSVSVGAAGNERQITNVAAGTTSTDAVNFAQLTAVTNNVNTLGSFAVNYDTNVGRVICGEW